MNVLKRSLLYLILAVLCKIIPYIITFSSILWTQDRIEGMKLGVIPGLIVPHLIFGFIFLTDTKIKKLIYSIFVAIVIYGIDYFLLKNSLTIETGWDMYGYWDLMVMNFITGIVIWEITYHIHRKIKK